jgi:nitrous oxide reductase accessory protein NosL
MAMLGAVLLAGIFMAGPAVRQLGAEEAKAPATEQAKMQPGMAEAKAPPVEHPMMKPAHYTDKGKCPNCGMMLNMWARTRHHFLLNGKELETCSIHCLAERAEREGAEPADVKVALYLEPEKMIAADQAVYVVGSTAPGTMTMVSKLAFADRAAAEKFAGEYGGVVTGYSLAFKQAVAQLDKDRTGIDTKRKNSGKIVIPTPEDRCIVCGMPPASYPNNRAQILNMGNKTLHFCSGRCLVYFLAEPAKYVEGEVKPMFIWASAYPESMYDYAAGLFYVVRSKAHGPMGPEPFAFRTMKQASEFAAQKGGTIVSFEKLTPEGLVQ